MDSPTVNDIIYGQSFWLSLQCLYQDYSLWTNTWGDRMMLIFMDSGRDLKQCLGLQYEN